MQRIYLLASAFALGLSSITTAAYAETGAEAVEVVNPYVREVPPVSQTSAAFMTLRNTGGAAHAVVAARSPAAQVVELHTHIMGDDGMHRMREVERIDVPAGGEAMLQPGGLHVMLINLNGPLAAGNEVEFTLVYDDGSEKTLTAPVKSVGETMMMQGKCGSGKCGSGKCGSGKCGGGK